MGKGFTDKQVEDFMIFLKAAIEACEDFDKDYAFTCPVCGGEAHASKTSYNGHHCGGCRTCDINFME